jgi:hypothetical protein
MDKETATELEKLRGELKAERVRTDAIEVDIATWKTLIKTAVVKTVKYLLGLGIAGMAFGWNLPENTREALIKMLSE